MIVALAVILVISYSFIGTATKPQNKKHKSAYDFFNNHPSPNISDIKPKKPTELPNKPHLLHVEGINQLYISRDISEGDSKPLLVWDHLRALLSRSDALPETAQGVKEASVAWKDLVSKFSNNDKKSEDEKNCPFSVDRLEAAALGDGMMVLELPCGLVEDSSISIVGIPDGPHRSFQIQLLGSQLSEEPKAPVVLNYNVSLPGDNMTEEPFVVQNTWIEELGWGKEERCPAHRSSNSLKGIFIAYFCLSNTIFLLRLFVAS